jgi:hypothetical protein
MFKLGENLNHLLLALIIGIASFGVSYVGDIAKSTQTVAVSVQELNIRMAQVTEITKDHEGRLREVEKLKLRR